MQQPRRLCKCIYTMRPTVICETRRRRCLRSANLRAADTPQSSQDVFFLSYFSSSVGEVILAWRGHLHPILTAPISCVNVNKDLSVQRRTALRHLIWKRTESPIIQQHKIFKSTIMDFWKALLLPISSGFLQSELIQVGKEFQYETWSNHTLYLHS